MCTPSSATGQQRAIKGWVVDTYRAYAGTRFVYSISGEAWVRYGVFLVLEQDFLLISDRRRGRFTPCFLTLVHVIVCVVGMIMNCAIEVKRIRASRLCSEILKMSESSIKPVNVSLHGVLQACWATLGTRQVQLECVGKG